MRTSIRYRDFQPDSRDYDVVSKLEGVAAGFSVNPRGRIYGVHCNGEFADSDVPILLSIDGLLEVTVVMFPHRTPRFTQIGFRELMTHPSIFGFGCSRNQFLGDGIARSAASSRRLRRLIIPGCPMTDVGVRELAENSMFQALSLAGSSISDVCVPDLCRLTELRELDVSSTTLADASLDLLLSKLVKCHKFRPQRPAQE